MAERRSLAGVEEQGTFITGSPGTWEIVQRRLAAILAGDSPVGGDCPCRAMREGFARHYQLAAAALHFFDIPHVHSAPFVDAIAKIIARYAPTAQDRAHLQQVAEAIVAYEQDFYDALMTPTA